MCVAVDVVRSFVNNVKMRRVTKVIYVKNTVAGLDYAMSIKKHRLQFVKIYEENHHYVKNFKILYFYPSWNSLKCYILMVIPSKYNLKKYL